MAAYVVHENDGAVGSIGGDLVPRDSVLTVVGEPGGVGGLGDLVGQSGCGEGEEGGNSTHDDGGVEKLQNEK